MRIGIICEYNPFHNGHIYHINKIKELYPDSTIILVVDSLFTERGDISVLDRISKTEIALQNNIDLVVELPFAFATQSADIFAYGAISILNKLEVDMLIFGSESNNIDSLKEAALTQIEDNNYNNIVKDFLNEGSNYPTALAKALNAITGSYINRPNDLLGISYIKAIIVTNSKIKPLTIERTNDYHDLTLSNISSASAIRKALNSKNDISTSVPEITKKYVSFIDENILFNYLKYKIISNISDLNKYQTTDEGIENRIKKFIYNAKSLDELILNIKSLKKKLKKEAFQFSTSTKIEVEKKIIMCILLVLILGAFYILSIFIDKEEIEAANEIVNEIEVEKVVENKTVKVDIKGAVKNPGVETTPSTPSESLGLGPGVRISSSGLGSSL